MGAYFNVERSVRYPTEWVVTPSYKYLMTNSVGSVSESYLKCFPGYSLKEMYRHLITKFEAIIRIDKEYPYFIVTFAKEAKAKIFEEELTALIKK